MVLGFIKCLEAGDRATCEIGLTRLVERRGSVRISFALGVLHSIGRRLMMKQPPNGLCGGGTPGWIPPARFVVRAARFARCMGRYAQRCPRRAR